uniref:YitH acetyltransferase (GNAT) domain-containing protein n=1 Tax=Plectus sambesii TaxID=2011161 RepID=A0A914WSS7_9BILA
MDSNSLTFSALCPPTLQQWKRIFQRARVENWKVSHWNYFLLMSKLSYANAIVCSQTTNGQEDYIGILIFVQPPAISVSYVGMYLVTEAYQGQGIGGKMWQMMKQHTDSGRTMALNAPEEMTKKYRAVDYPIAGETFHKIHGSVLQLQRALALFDTKSSTFFQVRRIAEKDAIAPVAKYDEEIVHFDRSQFWEQFFPLADGKVLIDGGGSVIAFGALFKTMVENVTRIGPVYADDIGKAIELLRELVCDMKETEYCITVPNNDFGNHMKDFLILKAECSLRPPLYRSYSRSFDYNFDWSKIFALSGHFAAPLL